MKMHWKNIFGIFIVIIGIYFFVKLMPLFDQWLEEFSYSYHFHSESPTMKIMMLGLLCVTIVVVVKIIANRNNP